jgi:hypothetical protein
MCRVSLRLFAFGHLRAGYYRVFFSASCRWVIM